MLYAWASSTRFTSILLLGILLANCLYLASQAITSTSGAIIAFIVGLFTSAVAFVVGLALGFYWKDRRRLVALSFALIFPIASFLTVLIASSFTTERQSQAYALVIAQALEQHRADHAAYPATLEQLIPDYLMDLREPKSIWGWLYEANEEGFLLGYGLILTGQDTVFFTLIHKHRTGFIRIHSCILLTCHPPHSRPTRNF